MCARNPNGCARCPCFATHSLTHYCWHYWRVTSRQGRVSQRIRRGRYVTAARAAAGASSLFFFLALRMPMPFARGIAHLSTHGAKSAHAKRTAPIQCTARGLPQAHCAVRFYAHALLSVQRVPGARAMGSSWPHFRSRWPSNQSRLFTFFQ